MADDLNDKKKRQNDVRNDNKERQERRKENVNDGDGDAELRLSQQFFGVMFGGDFLLSEALPYLDTVSILEKKIVCRQWKEKCDAAIDNKGRQEKKRFSDNAELRLVVTRYNRSDRDDIENIAEEYGYPIGKWDVSRMEDFSFVFFRMRSFNEDISAWDVGNATTMKRMFYSAHSFNQNLSGWDVSKVINMRAMFRYAHAFNGDVSAWDTSSVLDMDSMFNGAIAFNGDVSAWDTSSVTNMCWMFRGAAVFDGDISSWNVSQVTAMGRMFSCEDEEKFNRERLNLIRQNFEKQGKRWR